MKELRKYLCFIIFCFFLGFSITSCDITIGDETVCCTHDFPLPPLHQAVQRGDISEVKRLVEEEAVDMYSDRKPNITVLEIASRAGQKEMILYFIGKGMDINRRSSGGYTALHHVKDIPTAKVLLDNGADINIQDNHGWTPLMNSISKDKIKLAKFLIDKGADPNIPETDSGSTPLFLSIGKGKIELARLLFEKGANPYFEDRHGVTSLTLAKRIVGFFDFSLKKLIKDFEAYTPEKGTPNKIVYPYTIQSE